MALDPRSRERLEALGRRLPQPLPSPQPDRRQPDASAPRHAVETEQNPEQLFRELMAASADGTVPPHLLDRLRQLEQQRRASARAAVSTPTPAPGRPIPAGGGTAASPPPGQRRGIKGRNSSRRPAASGEEADLYTAFAQLLLEDEELD